MAKRFGLLPAWVHGGDRRLRGLVSRLDAARERANDRGLSEAEFRRARRAYDRLVRQYQAAMLRRRRNPPRKKKRTVGGEWQPDMFGGRGIERPDAFAPGLTRAQQLELAREEMRDTGSRDMFDLLGERNPSPRRRVTSNKPPIPAVQNGVHLLQGRDGFATYCERCEAPAGPLRATLQAAVADRIGHVHRNPGRDTPQLRYQRAIGHGERLSTARVAAANPGRATGRMAPNCPSCGALVRLPNPLPPTVTCQGCGQRSMVRRP